MKFTCMTFIGLILLSCGTQPEKNPLSHSTENEKHIDESLEKPMDNVASSDNLKGNSETTREIVNDWEIAQEYAEDLLLNNDIEILSYEDERLFCSHLSLNIHN